MPNRLAQETSPYLLQHANNPVDWYPWGDEAFARARAEDKPLLLSIGYAACHWCHVMERESFEDTDTAKLMNEHFVPVKVDREERPDVDSIYMGAVQALTGHGGWPMTVFCTPDGVPFIGGTYFPPEDRHGLPSFQSVLLRIDELWRTRRADLVQQGRQIVDAIMRPAPSSNEPLHSGLVAQATGHIVAGHDAAHGGFGGPPKFPQAPVLEFLLRSARRSPSVRDTLDTTLRAMAFGGIYDQLGGGFARYSVDATWTVPHFEKMLYDNAQLGRVYLHAWQVLGDELYLRIATETLEYLLADMRDDAGGFHSSEDADSEGEEGTFYVWSYDEFMRIAPDAADYYGVTQRGNFEGKNVLRAGSPQPRAAARTKLLAARAARLRPARDEKVLASWNGLAIGALAEVGAATGRLDFVEAATQAASFVLERMTDERGDLLHTYRGGRAHVRGLLEDYAYVAEGLHALWEATFDRRWLDETLRLVRRAVELFADSAEDGFFTAPPDHDLIVRQKEIIESATPAPGGVLALLLQKLAVLVDSPDFAATATRALRLARTYMDRAPQAVATWLSALDFYVSTPTEIAFTGPQETNHASDLARVVRSRYLPNRVIAGGASRADIALLRDKPSDPAPTVYVCEHYVCKEPTRDAGRLAQQLDGAA